MIPPFNLHGVLPPTVDTFPSGFDSISPYNTTAAEIVERFGTTKNRVNILKGLFEYRQLLKKAGFTKGFQWLNGSFIEDCENIRHTEPKDIDLVTFSLRPKTASSKAEWDLFIETNRALFDTESLKDNYFCDAYFVDLGLPVFSIINLTKYWFGLFSHQRHTSIWKGLINLPLEEDDGIAIKMLEEGACVL